MKNMIKDALILFAITLAAGLLLGFVNNVTKEPIAIAKENAKMEAFKEVFSNADSFEDVALEGRLAEIAGAFVDENGTYHNEINSVSKALKNNELLGYVFLVTNHEGFGGDIQLAVGITKEYMLNGISILAIEETPGLGMEAGDVLVPQFISKDLSKVYAETTLSPFAVTKTGSTTDLEIDAISGATITSKAVVGAVNSAVDFYEEAISNACLEGGNANE